MKLREVPGLWLFYALIGASLWGISGTVSSIIFIKFHFPVISLLMFRMLISGLFLFLLYRPRLPRKNFLLFLAYSIAGLTGVQFTYLETIALTNASTATILQYLYLPMVVLYTVISGSARITRLLTVTILFTMMGLFELITGFPGDPLSIIINPLGLIFGLLSAVTAALYTVLSKPLINKNGTIPTVAWALLIGGFITLPVGLIPSLEYFSTSGLTVIVYLSILILFVAIFGTMLAFLLYIKSMERISTTEASVAATMEPIWAAITTYVFLGIFLNTYQYFGGFLIVLSLTILRIGMRKRVE